MIRSCSCSSWGSCPWPWRSAQGGVWRRCWCPIGVLWRPACGRNSLQTPDDWIGRIQASPLALVVADREADTWASLQRWPLGLGPKASRPHSRAWLALPADWQEHPVLRHTARELGRMGGLQQLEG
jgi:hypothetical protein